MDNQTNNPSAGLRQNGLETARWDKPMTNTCPIHVKSSDGEDGGFIECGTATPLDIPELRGEPLYLTPRVHLMGDWSFNQGTFVKRYVFVPNRYDITDAITGAKIGPGGDSVEEAVNNLRNYFRSHNLPISRVMLSLSRTKVIEDYGIAPDVNR